MKRVPIVLTDTQVELFWKHVTKTESCWLWTGYRTSQGYGRFSVAYPMFRDKPVVMHSHRVAFTIIRGSIPDELEVDHLCRVRNCVNPEHLEPVTPRENTRRSYAARPRKSHCKQGHAFDEKNTRRNGGKCPQRVCRQCVRDRRGKRRATQPM